MLDRQKLETILANRFPDAEIVQRAAAANAIMALADDRSNSRAREIQERPEVFGAIAGKVRRTLERDLADFKNQIEGGLFAAGSSARPLRSRPEPPQISSASPLRLRQKREGGEL
jgi:hypothetical protein